MNRPSFHTPRLPPTLSLCIALFFRISLLAELPQAHLTSLIPAGATHGSTVEVTVTGQDLDDANRLYFSSPGITARPKTGEKGESIAGKFLVTVTPDVKPAFYDVRAIGRYGISNPRTFQVSAEPETITKPGNMSPQNALDFPINSAIHAIGEANAAHYFRLSLKKDQRLRIEASAARIESRMEPVLMLIDPNGRELARSQDGDPITCTAAVDGPYLLKVSDVLYRGGPEFFYRLSTTLDPKPTAECELRDFSSVRWPVPSAAAFLAISDCCEVTPLTASHAKPEEPQRLDPPCSVAGRFEGRDEQDWYSFTAPAGSVYWIEVISHRLGEPTSPMLLVQRLEQDPKGESKVVDVQEAYEPPPAGLPEFPASCRDPACRLEVKQSGNYRVMVRNLFQTPLMNRAPAYRLEIRKGSPDFQLVAVPASPLPDPKDSKDVPISNTPLRRGGVTPIRIVAQRRDGFAGEIHLQVKGLPAGVIAAASTIPSGATTATVLLTAATDAAEWVGPITITGTGHIGDADVSRDARPGVVSWSAYDKQNKRIDVLRARLCAEYMAAVIAEDCPLAIAQASERTLEAPVAGKLSIPLKIVRRAELAGPISLKIAGHPLLATAKEVTVDAKADTVTVDLDLNQTKLPPGEYTLYVDAQAKVKYTRKAAKKEDKEQVSDVTASFYSGSIAVRVLEAPKPAK